MNIRLISSLLTLVALVYLCRLGYQHRAAEQRSETQAFTTPQVAEDIPLPLGDRPAEVQNRNPLTVEPLAERGLSPVPGNAIRLPPLESLQFPVAGHGLEDVISVYGDPRGSRRTHQGIDIKAPRGTAVIAVADGFIERIREGGNAGKSIYLRAADGKLYFYAHLDDWVVAEMQAVRAGETLGSVGDSGNARNTTPHLHFELLVGKDREAIDPLPFFLAA